jgi:hypothetical protein
MSWRRSIADDLVLEGQIIVSIQSFALTGYFVSNELLVFIPEHKQSLGQNINENLSEPDPKGQISEICYNLPQLYIFI